MRIAGVILIVGLVIAACSTAETSPTPDAVATGVAEQRAIAATLTAEAPQPPAPTANAPPTPQPAQPTATQPPLPAPTDTPPPQEEAGQVVPAFGAANGLIGEIVVHNDPGPVADVPIFDNSIAFRLRVHDPDAGNEDGAGITSVDFSIVQIDTGETVHERTERTAGYCAFGGGEPICNVFDFAGSNFTWTNGQPIANGFYEVQAIVHTEDSDKDGANWGFTFEVRLP